MHLTASNALPSRLAMRRKGQRGFTIAEVIISAIVIAVVYISATQTVMLANRRSAAARLRTNARVIVERNIDQALAAPFGTATSVPAILGTTSPAGVTYDDDGNGDNKVNLMVQDTGGPTLIDGTLTRIVTAVANPEGADIRRVTFHLDYMFRGRAYTYEMTTLRTRG